MKYYIIFIFIILLILHLIYEKNKYKYIIHHTITIIITIIATIYNEFLNIYLGISIEINQLALKYALDDTKKYKSFFIITWYYRLIILCYLILSVLYKIIYININYIIFIPIIIYYPYHYTKLYYKLNKTNSELFN